jgi:PIN domain nuclease of toxin-antitoxin system
VTYLLDTCTFLWLVSEPQQLSASVQTIIQKPSNDIYLSVVSHWEISVKAKLGKLQLPGTASKFVSSMRIAHGLKSLAIAEDALQPLDGLPMLHKDPFDRMLICQAIAGGLTILTTDQLIVQYPVLSLW